MKTNEFEAEQLVPTQASELAELRSGCGSIPGSEFPTGVYMSIIGAFAWMIGVCWLAFAAPDSTDLDLTVVTLLAAVFFAIPLSMHRTATRGAAPAHVGMSEFLRSQVDTLTGAMPARQAWLEIMLIPAALALAATLIGGAYIFVG